MSRIYVETTIPSFYFEVRADAANIARRQWTREWFDAALKRDELVTSAAVIDELQNGDFASKEDALALIKVLSPLHISDEIRQIVSEYIKRQVMPANPSGDALHLAVASYYGCNFLATWNCRHLANANKFGHIAKVNGILGLDIPSLVTPLELLGVGADDNG